MGTRVLLDAMCTFKLLSKEGNSYSLVPESDYYLIPGKPTYQGNVLQNEYHWEGNGRLADAIPKGWGQCPPLQKDLIPHIQKNLREKGVVENWKGERQ